MSCRVSYWVILGALLASPVFAFERGVDVSSLARLESHGLHVRDSMGTTDALTALHRAGINAVRLRLWHTPTDTTAARSAMLTLARRAHALGMSLMLDLHYSDTWADPAHQAPPRAWNGLTHRVLADSVKAWTTATVSAFVDQGTPPAWVQIGNEVDHGLLWDAGRVHADDPRSWDRAARLLCVAANAVNSASPAPRTRIVLHVSGSKPGSALHAIERYAERSVPFDAIGVSYYPLWHGDLTRLGATLESLTRRFERPVLVVETAYPWTLGWYDDRHNVFGDARACLPEHPATPAGQASFVRDLRACIERTSRERGLGLYWWEPAWLAGHGEGSSWENATLFDERGALLPAARELGRH